MKRKPCLDWNGKRGEYHRIGDKASLHVYKEGDHWSAYASYLGLQILRQFNLESREDAMLACEDALCDYLQPLAELYQKLKENQ